MPERIVKRGLAVEIKDLLRLPDTRGVRPLDQERVAGRLGRASAMSATLPDGPPLSSNDSRGLLYLIASNNEPTCLRRRSPPHFPRARLQTGWKAGFIGFVFHPEFARNGLFLQPCTPSRGRGQSEDAGLHSSPASR